jgi:hypothetical protein
MMINDEFNQMVDAVTTRRCDGCSLCCTALEIFDLPFPKPMGQECPHLNCGQCVIYKTRPESCRTFYCTWRLSEFLHAGVPKKFRPADCGFVLHWDKGVSPLITLFHDPKRPRAWLKHKWALEKLARNTNCAIVIGGGDQATHFITPRGRWFARADHPQFFHDREIGVPSIEFLPRRK